MNVYTIAPLIAAIVYIPLFLTAAKSRPWQKRYTFFLIYIGAAVLWSVTDIFLRSNYFPEHKYLLLQLIIVTFSLMAVQLHLVVSSFFPKEKGRWLPFAYGSLVFIIVMAALGYVPESVQGANEITYLNYGKGVLFVAVPMLVLVGRNLYVFFRMLKHIDNPVLYNQIVTLIITVGILTLFTCATLLPIAQSFPITHYGNLIASLVLSYAVFRYQLMDIKLVIRRGTAWFILGAFGISIYSLSLTTLYKIFNFQLDTIAVISATLLAVAVSILVYLIRGSLFKMMSRVFHGPSYNYHLKLDEFTGKIHNIFSLKEQGGELVSLLIKALNIKQVGLLFPDFDTGDYTVNFSEPENDKNRLADFKLRSSNPIVIYLEKEKKFLTRDSLAVLPFFSSLWPQEREEIESNNISMFVPLISRERLIAILVLGEKLSGRFTLEDIHSLEKVTASVAVSMEKEYLREQVREREEELSVINNSSAILSSSLDIQEIFGSFIEELKKVVDVSWATIVLIEENEFVCVALSSPENSAYQIGDRIPMEGTGTAWVVAQKKPFIETDLAEEKYFTTSEFFCEHGLRSTAYLPLIAKGRIIGSFILASKIPNAFSRRHMKLLEQLASQIATPLENTQLYAMAKRKAGVDELTGLYNRRSLEEVIDSEISRHSRYGGTFALAILDLDSFKIYNDTYGHLAGDSLLQIVGRNIKGAVRNADYAFRYGGDEFAVLLPQTSIDAALGVLERVREKITDGVDTQKITITTSIGLACWPDDGISHTDIIASADVSLYRAKRQGGNQTICASGPLAGLMPSDSTSTNDSNMNQKLSYFVHAFAEMVDSRSYYTSKHSKKVADYSLALAKVHQLDKEEILKIETCALIHDIGKLGVDSEILNKSTELTEEEWQILRTHAKLGAEIIGRIPQLSHCADPILHHHEKYDGTGYPDGLKGEDIPLISRILAIANEFAVMTSDKSYSESKTNEKALEELKQRSGKDFDPYLVEQFVSIFKLRSNESKERHGGKAVRSLRYKSGLREES
ncbi:MAG: diguanylate cyclase [Dehalococcoidales bacterium]|nr:diguanylate cyclase [Dehalococcoidales bacterium]